MMQPLFRQIARCLNSSHFQVSTLQRNRPLPVSMRRTHMCTRVHAHLICAQLWTNRGALIRSSAEQPPDV